MCVICELHVTVLYFVHTLSITFKFLTLFVLNRIAELEKSLNDVNSKAIVHQKQLEHQIKELNLKYALYYTVRM